MVQVTGEPRREIAKLVDNDDVLISDSPLSGILAAIVASGVDLAALEVINTAIQTATQGMQATQGAVGVAAGVDGVSQAQLRYIGEALDDLDTTVKRVPVHTHTTVTTAAIATLTPGANFKLLAVRIHVSTGAPLAATETLTVTLDSGDGVAYDVVLFSLDMGTPDIRDLVIVFGGDEDFFESGDSIVIALSANGGSDTVGCETIHELV